MIRQPIISILGHVDHGKTSMLDWIRGSSVVDKEAGKITQHVSATEVPLDAVKRMCAGLGEIEINSPGLLFVDTPGHEAFTTLRKRGGALADLAILIIDINEGFMPQTEESLSILKHSKTPFVVAATKIDLIPNWKPAKNCSFAEAIKNQSPEVVENLDKKIYELMGKLSEHEISSDRFDRITDFTKQIGIIPVSSIHGVSISDVLMLLVGLSQKFLQDQLTIEVKGPGRGSVLELKEEKGIGSTLDVIVYDGILKKGDQIVLMGKNGPIETKVRGLFKPSPLTETKFGKQFAPVDEVSAASGVKVSAPNVEDVLSGSPLKVVSGNSEEMKKEVSTEFDQIKIETEDLGCVLKADTYGSLEALIAFLSENDIPIRYADIGPVSKRDIAEAETVAVADHFLGVVFAFSVDILPDARDKSTNNGIKIFEQPIIYKLAEEYKEWRDEELERQKSKKLDGVPRPAIIQFLPGYIFRQKDPAVFGIEVLEGMVVPKSQMMKEDGTLIGTVKEIQNDGENVQSASSGQKVALSVTGPTIGRTIKEGDKFMTSLTDKQMETLKNNKNLLTESEISALKSIILLNMDQNG
ncbi:translation initiation factor IF-2 [Candidatus Undinarchaeota archaeon]